jgi:hypothetical protein
MKLPSARVKGLNLSLLGGVLVIGLLIWLIISFSALIFVASLLGVYWLLSQYISARLADSKLFQLIIAVAGYSILLQIVTLGAWVFHRNFPLDLLVLMTGLIIFVLCLLQRRFTYKKLGVRLPIFTYIDIVSVGIALIIVAITLAAPIKDAFLQNGSVDIKAIAADYLNTSLDDSSHLSRINDRLQLNRGVLLNIDTEDQVVHQNSISTYPPGWHSANSVVIKALAPDITVGGQSLIAYLLTKTFWLFILVYCFSRVTFSLLSLFYVNKSKKLSLADQTWLGGSLLFFAYYILIEQFKEGFYNFIPLLIAQLLALLFLLQFGNDNEENADTNTVNFRAFVPLAIFMAGSVLTWFLVLPGVLLAIVACILYSSRHIAFRSTLTQFWQQTKSQVLLLALIAFSILVQYIILTADSARSFREGVNDPGAITAHSTWYFMFVVVGVILIFALSMRLVRALRYVTPYVVALLGFVLFIYLFQILTIHKPEYYYTKSLNTVMILIVPLALVGWMMLLKLASKHTGSSAVFLSLGLVFLLPLVIGLEPLNTSNLNYLKGKRPFTDRENSYIYSNLTERGLVPVRERKEDVIFYIPDEQGHNIIGTNIIRSIQRVDDCDGEVFYSLLINDEARLFKTIAQCQKDPLVILTRPSIEEQLEKRLDEYNISNNVTVTSVE